MNRPADFRVVPTARTPMDRPPVSFPFTTAFNLRRLIQLWEAKADDSDSPWHPFAKVVREQLAAAPALRAEVVDQRVLDEHRPLVDLMMSAVFPRADWHDQIAAVMAPFATGLVYAT